MKKALLIAGVGSVALASVAFADTVIQDFEAGTPGTDLAGNWFPAYSGSTSGVDANTDSAQYSNEQVHGGSVAGKLVWDWTGASGGFVRIQPASAGVISGSNLNVDRTSEPYIGYAIYASGTGDKMAFYMGEGSAGYGASPYERFTADYTLSFTGWRVVERNILTDPVVGWITGNGVLNSTCSFSGLFFYQAGTVTYYVDNLSFTTTTRNPDLLPDASVADWSVY